MNITLPKQFFIVSLIFLNLVPVYGVFAWGWQSFDLIYLYWLENLVVGLFAVTRFLLKKYSHPLEVGISAFMAGFFMFHYGMFCSGHGTFIISMFGKDVVSDVSLGDTFNAILPIIESQHLFWAVIALFIYQAMDWLRDVIEGGFDAGSTSIKDMMIEPYKRIIILHITILVSGFALGALDEPLVGLLILIALKISFELYHWNKAGQNKSKQKLMVLDENMKRKIDAMLENPKIVVNGEEIHFESYADLKASKYYRLMQMVLRFAGGTAQLKLAESYIEKQMNKNKL